MPGLAGRAGFDEWPETPVLGSCRLRLEPLRVEHAEEMASLLDDPELHRLIGGRPASLPELRDSYCRQVVGRSPDGSQRWLNWVVRRATDSQAVGTVQATVAGDTGGLVAEVAWVVATACQAQGYAREAAGAMVAWFRCQGVTTVVAHVHPDHRASSAVAAAVGLSPTTLMEEGEARWEGRAALDPPVGLTCHAITVVLRWSGAVSTRPAVNGIG